MSTYSYDEIPYPNTSFGQTHPIKMATIGTLFGLRPAAPDHCRVLELGCSDGTNMLPLAQNYPQSTFVGIDLSRLQIERGQKAIREIGLTNITLEHEDILKFDPKGMKFDYIIVHGIYSWVPDIVRQRILGICRDHLTDHGIAYVSYNSLPGWHMRGMLRDMMLYHSSEFPDLRGQLSQSRGLVTFLAQSVPTENNPYGQYLKRELQSMEKWEDGYLHHEFLETENRPFYFHEFIRSADKFDLQYLGEPELSNMLAANFTPVVQETLARIGRDLISMEQYMDFLRNRMFRMTLLVKKEVRMVRSIAAGVVRGFWVGAMGRSLKENVNFIPGEREEFRLFNDAVFSSTSALVKIVLVALQRAIPNQLSFAQLLAEVRNHILGGRSTIREPEEEAREEAVVCEQLMTLYGKGLIELSAFPYPVVEIKLDKKLKATALARYQALNDPVHVTNLRHISMQIDAFGRHVVALMDGNRDFAQIIDAMAEKVRGNIFNVQEDGKPVTDAARLNLILADRIAIVVENLARSSFLQAA